jgi:transcriptional regulator with XRE-family HTH domain
MSPAPSRELGEFIRRHREAAGLSMYKLAQEAGVPRSQVLRIERGDIQPGPETLARLAGPLKLEVEDLYPLAGYTAPEGLPGFETYLRTKFGMNDAAVAEAEDFFRDLQERQKGGRRGKRRR